MPIKVSPAERSQLESGQHVMRGTTGGPAKTRYWAPSGEMILAIPSNRVRYDGTVYDANYQKGWLPVPPPPGTEQIHCPGCDKWHQTQELVSKCMAEKAKEQERLIKSSLAKVKKEIPNTDVKKLEERVGKMENSLSNIETLLTKLIGGNNGPVLQHEDDGHELQSRVKGKGNGRPKKGIQ